MKTTQLFMAVLMGPELGGAEGRVGALHQEVEIRVRPKAAKEVQGLPCP